MRFSFALQSDTRSCATSLYINNLLVNARNTSIQTKILSPSAATAPSHSFSVSSVYVHRNGDRLSRSPEQFILVILHWDRANKIFENRFRVTPRYLHKLIFHLSHTVLCTVVSIVSCFDLSSLPSSTTSSPSTTSHNCLQH